MKGYGYFPLKLKEFLRKTPLVRAKRFWDKKFARPVISHAWSLPTDPRLKKTLLICVEASFNQNIYNAAYLTPLGFAEGWSEVAGRAKFIHVKDLMREINLYDDVSIFISQHSLRHFSFTEARQLRDKNMFVWVVVHPRSFGQFEKENPLISREESDMYYEAYAKLIVAEPKFVWNSIGIAGMHWYQGWIDDGFKWQTIFPGANTSFYFPEPSSEFHNVKVGYVGGYWKEKAQAFTSYLRPIEEDLAAYGYSRWPYKHYCGDLTIDEERRLYSSAGLIPLLTGPAGWRMAEITERYLKAPACKAFCIADENPAVREIFDETEMLQAVSAEHFHHLVNEFMQGRIDVNRWREAGYSATVKKHLVRHRALQILEALG